MSSHSGQKILCLCPEDRSDGGKRHAGGDGRDAEAGAKALGADMGILDANIGRDPGDLLWAVARDQGQSQRGLPVAFAGATAYATCPLPPPRGPALGL